MLEEVVCVLGCKHMAQCDALGRWERRQHHLHSELLSCFGEQARAGAGHRPHPSSSSPSLSSVFPLSCGEN